MDAEVLEKIRQLASEGKYKAQIAKMLGLNEATIRYQCKKNGIILSSGINKIHGEIEINIRKLIESGDHLSEIERKTGIDYNTILYWSKKNNITVANGRNKLKQARFTAEDIKADYDLGYGIKYMATKYNSCTRVIKRQLKHLGIDYINKSSGKYSEDELISKLPSNMKMTGKKDSGFYEVFCTIHPEQVYWRPATDLVHNCIKCNNTGTSKPQTEIAEWVRSLGFNVTEKLKIGPDRWKKELDIVVNKEDSSLNQPIAIEYNGLFWHKEHDPIMNKSQKETYETLNQEDKIKFLKVLVLNEQKKHLNKLKLAESEGYRLITIFADEWLYQKDQVKGYIKGLLGCNKETYYARNCEVREIDKDSAKKFLKQYHIQGAPSSVITALGLFHKEELVAVMTGGKHHRQNGIRHKEIMVINRLCIKSGTQVSGGASKLLKHLAIKSKSLGYLKIITWADLRWSQGNVYEKIGMTLTETAKPGYSYAKGSKRISKQSLKKKPFEKEIWSIKTKKQATEGELREWQGYYKIWDCGKQRWELDLTTTN